MSRKADDEPIEQNIALKLSMQTMELRAQLNTAIRERDEARRAVEEVIARLNHAEADAARLREVLVEHERKLVEVWGKEENPYAFAYGWVKPMRDAALGEGTP